MSSSETLDFVASVTVGRVSRAVISRVETRSFNTVKLNSHPESLRQFDDIFSDETVRGLVKTIRYDVVLLVVSDKRLRNKFQSSREAAKNSRIFTEAIVALFTRLSCWEARDVTLTLTATSPSDDPILRTGNFRVKQQRNLFKYISIEASVLPSVSCISFLDIQDFDSNTRHSSGRRFHLDVICVMAKALPCLEYTIWDLYMPPCRMPTLRKEFKAALASALLLFTWPKPVRFLGRRQATQHQLQPTCQWCPTPNIHPHGLSVWRSVWRNLQWRPNTFLLWTS